MSLKKHIAKCLNDMHVHRKTQIPQEILSERNTAEEIDASLDHVIQDIWMEMGDFHYFRSEWPNTVKSFRNALATERSDLAFMWLGMGYI